LAAQTFVVIEAVCWTAPNQNGAGHLMTPTHICHIKRD
jgi:hypothetical protein